MSVADVQFDFDAMLMFGWVADANGRIVAVNQSLRRWVGNNDLKLTEAAKLLKRIDGGSDVGIDELLGALLHPVRERDTPSMIAKAMQTLKEKIERLNIDRFDYVPDEPEEDGEYRIRYLYRESQSTGAPLLGVRFVRAGGTLLAVGRNIDRVDLIIVCRIEQEAVRRWRLRGFQGQLQEAWLRVESTIVRGTQSAAIALMARNLSHNIGSHALYWLAEETTDDAVKKFYKYLQIRMELIAGFATRMPLSTSDYTLRDLIEGFSDNALLLGRLCRSEGVSSIDIQYNDLPLFQVAIPGGEVGVHALYALLENCIRDSSKYAPRETPENLRFHVRAFDCREAVKVVLHDEGANYAAHGPSIASKLESLHLVNDGGGLEPGDWGLKERFICGALLRGIRPEAVPLAHEAAVEMSSLANFQPDALAPILRVENFDGNIGWVFYLRKPGAHVLLISHEGEDKYQTSDDVDHTPIEPFLNIVDQPTAVRQAYVVAAGLQPNELQELHSVLPKLPTRAFITPPPSQLLRGFVGIDAADGFEVEVLQKKWTENLLRAKGLDEPPPIIIAESGALINPLLSDRAQRGRPLQRWSENERAWVWSQTPPLIVIDEVHLTTHLQRQQERRAAAAIVYKRHFAEWDEHLRALISDRNVVRHFEVFSEDGARAGFTVGVRPLQAMNDPDFEWHAYELLESALTRVLIVDERISETVSERRLQRLKLAGVIIRGQEYGSYHGLPDGGVLRDWLAEEPWDVLVVHRGVLEKIAVRESRDVTDVVEELDRIGPRIVVHSGRMDVSRLPARTKFLSLANLSAWIDRDLAKIEIVNELAALRRV